MEGNKWKKVTKWLASVGVLRQVGMMRDGDVLQQLSGAMDDFASWALERV